jgi:LDH2 family malate/lactate/ureidoglycolate dehydrogenase
MAETIRPARSAGGKLIGSQYGVTPPPLALYRGTDPYTLTNADMQAITRDLAVSIEQLGRIETTQRIRQRVSAVFAFAMSEGTATHDAAAIGARALRPVQGRRRHSALLTIKDARELLAAAAGTDVAPSIEQASRFLALTAVRLPRCAA